MNRVSGVALLAGVSIGGAALAGTMAGGVVDQMRHNPASGLGLVTIPLGLIAAGGALASAAVGVASFNHPVSRIAAGIGLTAAMGAAAVGAYRLVDPR